MPRSLNFFSIAPDTPGSFLRSSATPRGPGRPWKAEPLVSAGSSSAAGAAEAPTSTRAEREASATRAAYEAHFSEAAYCARLASIAAPLIS